ncbi:MAG: tetratricopeptide repeat protein, partial [Bacteroidota bacterium]
MRKLFYAIVIVSMVTLSGCSLKQMVKLAEEQKLTVEPNPLELHGGKVDFEMSANLPVKMLKKGKVYTLNTYYKYGEQEKQLESLEFKAEDFPDSDTQQPQLSKGQSFDYDPAMSVGTLEIEGVASDPRNGKSANTPRLEVAEGIITTSLLVQPVFFSAYADHGYNNKEELIPTRVSFFFEQGSPNLRYSEKRSDRGKQFSAFVAEKNVTRTVTITGTHSPEGPERINSKLASQRATSIENYYRQQMKKYDYKGYADSIKFILKDVVEDWTQFKEKLNSYGGISQTEKQEYLDVVNGSGSFEEKEDQLQKLSTYKKVFKDIYPELRTAKTEILTVKIKKPDAVIAVLAKEVSQGSAPADTLSSEELLFGASLTPSLSEKEAIYKASIKKDDSWVAHNNLGAVYLEMATTANGSQQTEMIDQAITQLEIAQKKNESAEVMANLGTAYAMQGNTDKALEAISSALSKGLGSENQSGINGVKGSLEIKKADYSTAVSSTNSATETATNLFNKGLAQLLNKQYENALTSFDEAIDKDSDMALAHYCSAIASARLGKEAQGLD